MTIENVGWFDTNSIRSSPRLASSQFTTPKSLLNIWFFQINPATTGMIRNGVISNVRTMPRPKNVRSSRIASKVPSKSETSTAETVITMLTTTASRKKPSLTSSR